ncbi:hypothetical protein ACFSQP_07960 [Bizionia sediminis]|uniref:TonB-dependent receptor n=1 Tax=Bizionia sediminis TaxID=1737064 RepID=A0ABW5KT24_9FLAO
MIGVSNSRFFNRQDLDAIFLNQNIEWHKKASKKHTFSFAADFVYDKNNSTTFWESNDAILDGLIPVIDEAVIKLNQLKETKSTNFNLYFKYYWVLNKNNHIYTTIGNSYLNQFFYTNDSQELLDGTINNFNSSGFGNDLNFSLNDLFLGLNYKFKTGIFTFNQGAFFHAYNWDLDNESKITKNKFVILPNFTAKIDFNTSKRLQFNYDLKTSFSDVSKFANQFYLQSYNSVFKGNEELENELYHVLSLGYRKFSTYRGVMLYANARYTKKIDGVLNMVNYVNANQFVSVVMLKNPSENWQIMGNISKKIKKIKFGLGLSYNGSNYLQQIDGFFQNSRNNQTGLNVTAKTLYKNFPTVEIGYKHDIGNYTSGNMKAEFITNKPFINIDYDFLNGFIFSLDYNMYRYKNKSFNQNSTYDLANMSLYYRHENSAWSFKIESNNVFDVQFRRQNSFSAYIISDSKTYIMPQTLMFTLGYNL